MAQWQVKPIDWLGEPIKRRNAEGKLVELPAVLVEAVNRQDAEGRAFALPGFPQGPVETRPVGDRPRADTLPCGCRRTGMSRVRGGVTYQTVRTPRRVNGDWRCEGCA